MSTGLQGITLWAAPCGAADLTGRCFYLAKLDTSTGDVVLAGLGDPVVGVIVEDAEPGNPVSLQCDGVAKVILGANTSPGVRVTSNADGEAIAGDPAHGEDIFGITLTGGGTGDIVSVLLK